MAQRLVRKICPRCKEPYNLPAKTLKSMNINLNGDQQIFHGKGCLQCENVGYKGRAAVFEILEVNEEIKKAVLDCASFEHIKKLAKENGMRSLREDAFAKALDGVTTLEEVIRVTKPEFIDKNDIQSDDLFAKTPG